MYPVLRHCAPILVCVHLVTDIAGIIVTLSLSQCAGRRGHRGKVGLEKENLFE